MIEPLSVDLATLLENMKKSGKLTEGQFALGTTKVFLKNKAANEMDTLREAAFIVQAVKVTQNKIHRANHQDEFSEFNVFLVVSRL